jgi:polyisoprenoid-binding protein YceI
MSFRLKAPVLGMTVFVLSFAVDAQGDSADFAVDTAHSQAAYHLVHKMHEVTGVSKQCQGRARLADGKAQVMVRIPAQSFDSGNVNRDEHMKETVEAARFPNVELKALGEGITPPASFPSTTQAKLKGQLTFHGVPQLLELPVTLVWESPTRVRAQTKFNISLDAFKVERPSLMFIKVDDALELTADLLLTR